VLTKKESRLRYEVAEIPIASIDYEEQQLRDVQVDDEIHQLASSIAALDLLQFPGVIRQDNGRFALAWGRRRLEAFKLSKSELIPCRIYHGDLESIKALALVENLQRRPMSIKEECDAVRYLAENKALPIDTIVAQLGRTRSWVNQRLAVPSFPEEIKEALLEGLIGLGAAEALAICTNESARAYILSQAVHTRLTIPEIRSLVKSSLDLPSQDAAIKAGLDSSREGFSPQESFIVCAACGNPRPLACLTFVRVCNDGCSITAMGKLSDRSPDAPLGSTIPNPA
jgi:ParB family chromosome partitioning protein